MCGGLGERQQNWGDSGRTQAVGTTFAKPWREFWDSQFMWVEMRFLNFILDSAWSQEKIFSRGATQSDVCFIKFTLAALRTDWRGPEWQSGSRKVNEIASVALLRTHGDLGEGESCGDGEKVDLNDIWEAK